MADIYSDIPELSAEQAGILRRQKIAQMIQAQSMQPLESQQIPNGYVVPTNPLLALGKMGEAYLGKQAADKADAKQAGLSDKYNTIVNADRQSIVDALVSKGTPAQPAVTLPQDESGNKMTRPAQPAMAGEPMSLLDKQQALIQNYGTLRTKEGRDTNKLQQKYIEAQLAAEQKVQDKADAKANNPYFNFIGTPQGIAVGDARTGNVKLSNPVDGNILVKSQDSPELQGKISGSKEAGKDLAKSQTTAQINLPKNIQEANNTIGLIDDLLAHPGFKQAVGKSSMMGIQYVPGTDAKDFKIREQQLLGKQFLQAYETLKGGGSITEVEGTKATNALSRMNAGGTEESYIKAAKEFQDIIRQGVEREKIKAGQSVQQLVNNRRSTDTMPTYNEFDSLPSGTKFTDPDGKVRMKP